MVRTHLVASLSSLLGLCLLGMLPLPALAQEAGDDGALSPADAAPAKLLPVRLWVAGRTLSLRTSPLTDTRETYVPLTALAAVGAQFRLVSNGNAVRITTRSNRQADIPLVEMNGAAMIALSELAELLDASVETSATQPGARPTFRSNDTVYLLARVTDARFENGWLRVRTSFPVPSHARMLEEANPVRGYIDFVGAEVSDDFRPMPLRPGERQALRLRAGQNSPTVARVVVELPNGGALKTGDSAGGSIEASALAFMKPGWKLPESVARVRVDPPAPARPADPGPIAKADPAGRSLEETEQGGRADGAEGSSEQGPAQPDASAGASQSGAQPASGAAPKAAARPPITVRGLEIAADDPSVLRFYVTTGDRVRPIVRYTPGTTQMLVDIPNSVLAFPDGVEADRTLTHPLISGARLETIEGTTRPMTRLTLDTARILGYSLNVQPGSFTLELRMPRNATGILADKLIVVDAGHGGSATGAKGGGICEKDCTLAIALKLRAELESLGARVVMTRTRDADVSLTDRSRMGNEIGADLFVSIHNDSNERSNSASGTSTYYHNSDPSSRALATCVQHAVMATTGLPSRGVLSDTVMYHSGFAVLRGSAMPAVLCEVAYINNQTDRRKLIDPQFQQRVAKAVADGLRNYVEGTPKRTAPAFARPAHGTVPADSGDSAAGASGS